MIKLKWQNVFRAHAYGFATNLYVQSAIFIGLLNI